MAPLKGSDGQQPSFLSHRSKVSTDFDHFHIMYCLPHDCLIRFETLCISPIGYPNALCAAVKVEWPAIRMLGCDANV